MEIQYGADPELFLFKEGNPVSGYGLIEGSKHNPFPVNDGAVQVDGMALEFNINPANNENEFVHNLTSVLKQLRAMVPDYELLPVPVAEFTEEYIKTQPEEAVILGCDPDYNAWHGGINPIPDAKVAFRTGSGHIHIGWTNDMAIEDEAHQKAAFALVKQLDFYLGLPSVIFDEDKKRRELYGKAGACRVKPYGVEYRVLSNIWLRSEDLMRWVFQSTDKAVKDLVNGKILSDIYGDIQEVINSSDRKEAEKLIRHANLALPA